MQLFHVLRNDFHDDDDRNAENHAPGYAGRLIPILTPGKPIPTLT